MQLGQVSLGSASDFFYFSRFEQPFEVGVAVIQVFGDIGIVDLELPGNIGRGRRVYATETQESYCNDSNCQPHDEQI
jgi:hypothetical protein